jgi:hypothetical protein
VVGVIREFHVDGIDRREFALEVGHTDQIVEAASTGSLVGLKLFVELVTDRVFGIDIEGIGIFELVGIVDMVIVIVERCVVAVAIGRMLGRADGGFECGAATGAVWCVA